MPEAVLYDYWRSTASWRVRIALNLAGLVWESRSVDLVAGEQRGGAHLARNPQALVPVLEIDGLRLTQSLAMLDYLEETGRLSLRPEPPGSRPPGPAGRPCARTSSRTAAADSGLL